jgi:predicted transcriptional regulator of viral defense system
MAHSVYISSNLSQQQLEFMKLLDDYEIELFQFDEIESQINRKFDNLNEVLENLVHKELLSRIERGKFCKVNFRDVNVIGTFVVKNSAVAYWSALNLHGLTEQFSNTIFIQTTYRKTDKILLGTFYKFVTINPAVLFNSTKIEY